MISKNIGYIRKLDHLRFFAALIVGIYHFYHFQTPNYTGGADSWIKTKNILSAFVIEGHTGVALFMVLSGFIFAAIGYKRNIVYKDFVVNRILRIVPLFGVAIFVAATLSPQGTRAFVTTFLFPVTGAGEVNYPPITTHLWTIRPEFQFYLLFPFLIMFIGRYGMRYALGLLVFMVSVRAMIWWSSESVQLKKVAYLTILGRLDQFVIGMVAGCLYSGRSRWTLPPWLKHWSTAVLSFSAPLGCIYYFHRQGGWGHLRPGASLWIYWPDLEALAWVFFVLAYVKCEADWPEKVSRIFSWLGTLSFSIYVNHLLFVHDFPAHRYLPQLTRSHTLNAAVSFTFVILPFLAGFCWLTYQIIERPFIEMRRSYIRKRKDESESDETSPAVLREASLGVQAASQQCHYRGMPMEKSPFDVAVLPMLVWKLKPATIFDIGSQSGACALWLGDMLNSYGLGSHVYSLGSVKSDSASHPRVKFMSGNGRALEQTLTPQFLEHLPRPWLIICDTSIVTLRFFHPWLRAGDYLVAGAGAAPDLTKEHGSTSDPNLALKEFLAQYPGEYEIAEEYGDFLGTGLTTCASGFLCKVNMDSSLVSIRALMDSSRHREAFALLNEIKARRIPVRGADYLRAVCFVKEGQPFAAVEALKEELRYFPNDGSSKVLLESLAPANRPAPAAAGGEFDEILRTIRPYTMLGEPRLLSLYRIAREICERDVPGNFVECGVAAGGSSALLAAVVARHSRRPRRLYSFDTFEGMPVSTELDTHQGQSAEASGWGAGTCSAPEASLREVCGKMDVTALVEPIKGLFSESLPIWRERIGAIAFLHMDGDWYSSTNDILENLFDHVVPGGHIQIDDYGYWDGCRRAVADFEHKRGLKFELHRIDETGVWLAR